MSGSGGAAASNAANAVLPNAAAGLGVANAVFSTAAGLGEPNAVLPNAAAGLGEGEANAVFPAAGRAPNGTSFAGPPAARSGGGDLITPAQQNETENALLIHLAEQLPIDIVKNCPDLTPGEVFAELRAQFAPAPEEVKAALETAITNARRAASSIIGSAALGVAAAAAATGSVLGATWRMAAQTVGWGRAAAVAAAPTVSIAVQVIRDIANSKKTWISKSYQLCLANWIKDSSILPQDKMSLISYLQSLKIPLDELRNLSVNSISPTDAGLKQINSRNAVTLRNAQEDLASARAAYVAATWDTALKQLDTVNIFAGNAKNLLRQETGKTDLMKQWNSTTLAAAEATELGCFFMVLIYDAHNYRRLREIRTRIASELGPVPTIPTCSLLNLCARGKPHTTQLARASSIITVKTPGVFTDTVTEVAGNTAESIAKTAALVSARVEELKRALKDKSARDNYLLKAWDCLNHTVPQLDFPTVIEGNEKLWNEMINNIRNKQEIRESGKRKRNAAEKVSAERLAAAAEAIKFTSITGPTVSGAAAARKEKELLPGTAALYSIVGQNALAEGLKAARSAHKSGLGGSGPVTGLTAALAAGRRKPPNAVTALRREQPGLAFAGRNALGATVYAPASNTPSTTAPAPASKKPRKTEYMKGYNADEESNTEQGGGYRKSKSRKVHRKIHRKVHRKTQKTKRTHRKVHRKVHRKTKRNHRKSNSKSRKQSRN